MKIKIKGKYFNKHDRELLTEFADWTCIKLLGKEISNEIELTLHLVGLTMYKEDAFLATTEIDPKDKLSTPRHFIITITNKFKILRTLMLLAHEMVHLKQHAINELKYGSDNTTIWLDKIIDEKEVNYWDLPWEIEAHGREKGLVHQWVLDKKISQCTWYKEIF
jgi:hypothetical protein